MRGGRYTRAAEFLAAAAAVAALALGPAPDAGADAPPLDELPILSQAVDAGQLELGPAPARTPSRKRIDGHRGDWIGERTGLGGALHRSAGELIYEDFLFDDHGADNGLDLALGALGDELVRLVPQLERPVRAGPAFVGFAVVLAGLAADSPIPMHAGDAEPPAGEHQLADLTEARLAADGSDLVLLARTSRMRDPGDAAILVLLDLDSAGAGAARPVPFGSGLRTRRAELAVLLGATDRPRIANLTDGTVRSAGELAIRPDGFANAIEARIPLPKRTRSVGVALASGYPRDGGDALAPVGPDGGPNVVNVAYRREPVSLSMDYAQALALARGRIDEAFAEVDLAALHRGATESATPGPGYYEAQFDSRTPGLAKEDLPRQGRRQHYALYVPTTWRPERREPATLWLHYGNGTTHHLGMFQSRLVRQLGEARDNVIVGPSGRGSLNFYSGEGYADVFEALADSDRFGRDPNRTSIAGYSMGSYGTMLLTSLHPDRWAGALGADGTPPSYYDGFTQNTANAAAVPFVLMGGLAYTQMRPDYDRLRRAGGTARLYLYPVEHVTNVIFDQWRELTEALGQPIRERRPERVRYTRVPAIERAVATGDLAPDVAVHENPFTAEVNADGAFWVDGIRVRAGDPTSLETTAVVDATTDGFGHRPRVQVREQGVGQRGAVLPYLVDGVRYRDFGPPTRRANSFRATLTNVARVRLALGEMGIRTDRPIAATVITDGPTTIRLIARGMRPHVIRIAAPGEHPVFIPAGAWRGGSNYDREAK